MLFAFLYKVRASADEEDIRRLRRLFITWEPPPGIEIKHHYAFARGGGVAIAEATSPSTIWESLARFSPLVDIDIEPALNVIEALAISLDVDEWSNSVRSNDG